MPAGVFTLHDKFFERQNCLIFTITYYLQPASNKIPNSTLIAVNQYGF